MPNYIYYMNQSNIKIKYSRVKMSYAYLFKYIIIGDTGKSAIWLTNFLLRSRKVMSLTTIHGQAVPSVARSYDWCGVWCSNNLDSGEKHKVVNLGHRWPRVIQVNHKIILSRCSRSSPCLRYNTTRHIHPSHTLAGGGQAKWKS